MTYIINGFDETTFSALLQGDNPGTLFTPFDKPMEESQHWMTHTAAEYGELVVESERIDKTDELNCKEILSIEGEFSAGETVLIKYTKGQRLAKASSNYSSCLLHFVTQNTVGVNTSQMQRSMGPIISNNDIAVLEKK
jgi:glutamate 5-kinase